MWKERLPKMNSNLHLLTGLALCASFFAGCGELDDLGPAPETEPTTGMVNQPVRYGSLDGDGHPGILRLHIRVGASGFLCSGTVIEQRTILTAAHLQHAQSEPEHRVPARPKEPAEPSSRLPTKCKQL